MALLALWTAACGTAAPAARTLESPRAEPSSSSCGPEAPEPWPSQPRAPVTLRMSASPMRPGPIGVVEAQAVWTGDEVVLFAGAEPEVPGPPGATSSRRGAVWRESSTGDPWTGLGFAYDPGTERWRTIPGSPPPGSNPRTPIAWHCGALFLLTVDGSGYRIDPRSGQVTATSTEGAPRTCRGPIHTEGPLAYVSGCGSCTGSMYDAEADRWTAIGTEGDPISPQRADCNTPWTALAGGRLIVLARATRARGMLGAVYDAGTERWQAVARDGMPLQLLTNPVPDGRGAIHAVGTAGDGVPAAYRYDLDAGAWSHRPLPSDACAIAPSAVLREGILYQLGGYREAAGPDASFVCATDLVHHTAAGRLRDQHVRQPVAFTWAGDRIFAWGEVTATGHGHGEMPRQPTIAVDNQGWMIEVSAAP